MADTPNDAPNDTPQALVDLSAMMRSTSLDIAKATRPILDQTRIQMAQTVSEMFNQFDTSQMFSQIDTSQMFARIDISQMFKPLPIVKASDFIDTSQISQLSKMLTDAVLPAAKMFQAIGKAIPSNLKSFEDLDDLLILTSEEGIPVAWVPRAEVLQLLVAAHDTPTRRQILIDHRDDILDDCLTALEDGKASLEHHTADVSAMCLELVGESDEAIRTLKAGFSRSAQSHAANIIESIAPYMAYFPSQTWDRSATLELAEENIDGETSVILYMHCLALRPLIPAFESWYASSGKPPPDQFARHVTAHGVGHPEVFKEHYALIAVMLATSLTRQLCNDIDRCLSSISEAA